MKPECKFCLREGRRSVTMKPILATSSAELPFGKVINVYRCEYDHIDAELSDSCCACEDFLAHEGASQS